MTQAECGLFADADMISTCLQRMSCNGVIDQLIPGVKYEVFEDRMVANDTVSLEGEDKVLFKRLVTLLDDVDDVQQVYHNVDNLDD